jgi:hypothetical protein
MEQTIHDIRTSNIQSVPDTQADENGDEANKVLPGACAKRGGDQADKIL